MHLPGWELPLNSRDSAPLPKFVLHCSTLSHELRKQMGH
jgi:hypothetical protein